MIFFFLLAIELCFIFFPTVAHSSSLRGQSQEIPYKSQFAKSLPSRQIPGVIAASDFLRRGYHASVLAGSYVYIDGGDFAWSNNGDTNYDYSSTILSIDLSQTWTNSSVTIRSTSKPSGVPSLNKPSLWYDKKNDVLYTGYAGEPSYVAANRPIPPSSLWAFKPDHTGSGSWSKVIGSDDSVWSSIKHSNNGLMAYGPDNAFVLGGSDPFNNNALLPGLVQFNFAKRSWSNSSASGYNTNGTVESGALHYVPTFGPGGLLVVLGGENLTDLNDFGKISVYDPISQKWFNQTTTGNTPEPRKEFCTAGIASTDGTYEIFVYAGWANHLGTPAVPLDTVYILTLPAFHWIQVDYSPQNPRHGLSCNAVGGSQILIIGGVNSNPNLPYGHPFDISRSTYNTSADPFTQGLAIFDITTLRFANQYTANAPPYVQSDLVQKYYASHPNPNITSGLDALLKETHFTNGSTNSAGSSSSNTTTSVGSTSTSSNVGAIAGGTIGGVAAVVLIGVVLVFFRRRQRAQVYKSIGAEEFHPPGHDGDQRGFYGSQKQPIPLQEMDTQPSELTGPDVPVELSGTERRAERSELG